MAAQSPLGRWIIRDIRVSKIGKESEEEKKYYNQLRDSLLKPSFGTLVHDYKKDGTLIYYSIEGSDTNAYDGVEWWMKNKIFYTSVHEPVEDYPNTWTLKQNTLCVTSSLTPEGIVMKTWYERLPSFPDQKHNPEQVKLFFSSGIAPLENKWSMEEYRDAIAIVCDLYDQKKSALPHHSDSSMQLLRKLTDVTSLKSLFANAQTTNEAYFVVSYSKTLIQLLMRYGLVAKKEGEIQYSNEKVRVYTTVLAVMDELIRIINESVQNENLSASRKQSVIEHRDKSLPQLIDGCLTILKDEYHNYRKADICAFGLSFFDFYKRQSLFLTEDFKAESDKRLRDIEETHPVDCLRTKK